MMIRVEYKDGRQQLVRPHKLKKLIASRQIVRFERSGGWAFKAIIAIVALVWDGSPYLGLVVGATLALNTVIAVSLGGTIPLLLKRLGVDPAIASGPILTTVTDICGFFLALSFASLLLTRLT